MVDVEVNRRSFEDENYEVVERRGVGHPDSFSDSISDIGCQALCDYYLEEYDYVLPHHLNKVSILNGETIPEFQGGKIEEPIKIILGGVAIDKVIDGDEEIEVPVFDIVVDAVKEYLNDRFPHLEVDKQTKFIDRIRSGSVELEDIRNKDGMSPIPAKTQVWV
jgi:S-adenosylmethionine synthetase